MKSKHKGIVYKCQQCSNEYTRKEHLQKHIKSLHLGKTDNHPKFRSGTSLGDLKTNIDSKSIGIMYTCQLCTSEFTLKKDLHTHMKSKHQKIMYNCQQCSSEFTTKEYLQIHIRSKHQGIIYTCPQYRR